ncbi:MAG: transglutaminase family protein, partial [Anaerolineae bacterium]
MIFKKFVIVIFFSLISASLSGKEIKSDTLKTLYNSLDPLSISEHLAFYELYSSTPEGKKALRHVWQLVQGDALHPQNTLPVPKLDIQAIISIVTRQAFDPPTILNEEQLSLIEEVSRPLANRRLKGFRVWTKEELLALTPEEVDLCRGLLINQFDTSKNIQDDIRQYEASLDLMALQIAVRLPSSASPQDKIREINRFIFQEMQFRFPPHSLYAQDIDLYTFLPSVLDSRQGVCLGVSILYLCLAQRLDLPLEIITPPGHIYVRFRQSDEVINIETTARGINMASDAYLGINTRKLDVRTIKEVIGMAFINQASVYWSKGDYSKTVSLYEKALPYLKDDPLIKMLLGFNYLFIG